MSNTAKVLAEGWEWIRLKHLCVRSALYGANESADSYVEEGVRFLRTTDIGDDGELRQSGAVFLPEETIKDYLLADGDLLISRSGTIGRSFVYSKAAHGRCAYAGYLVRFVPGARLNPRFAFYVTKSNHFYSWLESQVVSSTIGNVNGQKYGNLLVPTPAIDKQREVVAFLDRETAMLDDLLRQKQRFLQLTDDSRRAVVAQAVTRGIRDMPLVPSGVEWFGSVPQHWTVNRLGRLAVEINDVNHEMPDAVEDGVPFLSAKDFKDDGSLNFSEDVKLISREAFARLGAKITPKRDDIVYSRYGACLGKARLVETDQEFLVSYSCVIIRLRKDLADPRFFAYLLDSDLVLTDARLRTQGIAVPDLVTR